MPRGSTLPPHSHDRCQVVATLEGSGFEAWGGRTYRIRPGALLVRAADELHSNQYDADWDPLTILVSFERGRFPSLAKRPFRCGVLADDISGDLLHELRSMDEHAPMALQGLSLVLAARAMRLRERFPPEWFLDAVAYIQSCWSQRISLSKVSARVGIHPTSLASVFRRELGCSVGEMVTRLRVRNAARLIDETKRPFAEIALECGFYDQSHMVRLVRRHTGHTPGEIRRRHS